MIWVKDKTGRFLKRPHFEPEELDAECERTVTGFLRERHGAISFPISTDDLTVLLEQNVGSLDLYATSAELGDDTEGVTDFFTKKKPNVRINQRLSSDPRYENRLRTTLTHELGHVKLQGFMYSDLEVTPSLFGPPDKGESNQCKRASMLTMNQADWMEWQAGFACGAYLMPITLLKRSVKDFAKKYDALPPRISVQSKQGQDLIEQVASDYSVSKDAARVRLLQRNFLVEGAMAESLF